MSEGFVREFRKKAFPEWSGEGKGRCANKSTPASGTQK